MKLFLIGAFFVSCAYAAAVDEKSAEVLKNEYDLQPEGAYQAAYETSNGVNSQQSAVVKPSSINQGQSALEVHGSYSYQSPEGETIQINYVADENGFQPQGNHLPTTPEPMPIPDYIARAIQYIAEHPYQEKKL
ncbi:hypothetical protein O0L34_g5894 [Tuta absoluta]|nr:hypothetical protein O0L34_g5894 [Tuta absoluta]